MVIPLISKSALSVSGPAVSSITICAMATAQVGSIEISLSVALAGLLQVLAGVLRLGGFTHLYSFIRYQRNACLHWYYSDQQTSPLVIGYDKQDFWREELLNFLTFHNDFEHISSLPERVSAGTILIALLCLLFLVVWGEKDRRQDSLFTGFVHYCIAGVLAGSFAGHLLPR